MNNNNKKNEVFKKHLALLFRIVLLLIDMKDRNLKKNI